MRLLASFILFLLITECKPTEKTVEKPTETDKIHFTLVNSTEHLGKSSYTRIRTYSATGNKFSLKTSGRGKGSSSDDDGTYQLNKEQIKELWDLILSNNLRQDYTQKGSKNQSVPYTNTSVLFKMGTYKIEITSTNKQNKPRLQAQVIQLASRLDAFINEQQQ